MNLFVVPTISFRLLYGLLICGMTTTHPTAEWIARQLTEACGWDEAPRYLIRCWCSSARNPLLRNQAILSDKR